MIETIFLTIYVIGAVIVFLGQLQNGFLIALITAAVWPVASLFLTLWLFWKVFNAESNRHSSTTSRIPVHDQDSENLLDGSTSVQKDDAAIVGVSVAAVNKQTMDWAESVADWLETIAAFCYDDQGNLVPEGGALADAIKSNNVEEINFSYATVRDVPEGFSRLSNLKKIEITSRSLSEVPEEILLDSLEVLDLSFNELEAIQPKILNLKFLKELHVSNNKMKSFAEETLPDNLEVLDISSNELETVQSIALNPKFLRELYLSDNKLKSLPEQIVDLSHLEVIDLSDNEGLILSESQEQWLKTLEENGGEVRLESPECPF